MIILDTNFICSLFNLQDTNHAKAKEIFFGLPNTEKIAIPFIVAAELAMNHNSEKHLGAAKEITTKFLVNNEQDLESITELSPDIRKKLKISDCLIITLCKRHKAQLLTFNKEILKGYSHLNMIACNS